MYREWLVIKNDYVVVTIMRNKNDNTYSFVNLTKGHICPCRFASEKDALLDLKNKKECGEIIDYFKLKGDYDKMNVVELCNEKCELDRNFEQGDIVRHFKGGLYRIVAIATHSETREQLVIYESLKDKNVCARPYEMFISDVNKEKYPNCTHKYRFVKVAFI